MFPTINIGGLSFPTAGLVILIGTWLCLTLVERTADRIGHARELILGAAATGVFNGVIGARMQFVPLNTGYNAWGGLLLGLAGAFFYARVKRLAAQPTLDALAPGIVLGLMVVSLADFLGGPGFGSLTAVPWGVTQFGVRRHPVQLYELLVGGLALLAWWRASRPAVCVVGRPFLLTTAVYSAGRLFVDAFRDNAPVIGDGYHVWQIVSLLILLAALFQIGRAVKNVPDSH